MPALEARIRREAADAQRDEALLPSFRALRLNMGTDDVAVSVLIGADTWRRHTGDAPREGPVIWGIRPWAKRGNGGRLRLLATDGPA